MIKFIREPRTVIDGLPIFSKDVYWGKLSKEHMEDALRLIDKDGWEAFDSKYKHTFDFTYEEDRADWRFVVPMTKDSTVLDIGAGMGRSSIPLARVVKEVIAFDQSSLRMRFLKRRKAQANLENITIFVGDLFDLPLLEASIDVIVMNGILEWVGKTDKYSDPNTAQIEALKICRKLLKPGGYIYVGIENRLALAYLKGVDHSGLRFTSFMPRFMANWYMKLRKGEKYDTYTYSKNNLTKLFTVAGFSSIDVFLPYPGYNLPRLLIPYNNIAVLKYVILRMMKGNTLSRKLIQFISRFTIFVRLYRYFFFSFNIIAKK